MNNIKIERIASLNGDFFPYVLARLPRTDVHLIGVMDLKDENIAEGKESDIILYFLITPEEFANYPDNLSALNDLAQLLQIRMPKNRFLLGHSGSGKSQEEINEVVERSLDVDSLPEDTAFTKWLEERKERASALPVTPYNTARQALYDHQAEVKRYDDAIKNQNGDLETLRAERASAAENGKSLEQAFGKEVLTLDALYLAMDTCWPQKYPLVSPANGAAILFSKEELADRYVKEVTSRKHSFVTIKKIENSDIEATLRSFSDMGINVLLFDDGERPVRILSQNIITLPEQEFIERYNSDLRNFMIRLKQIGAMFALHEKEMEESWKTLLKNIAKQLEFHLFRSLASTVLFVPAQAPKAQLDQLKNNYIVTPEANNNLTTLIRERKIESPIMVPEGFTGKQMVLPYKGTLPLVKLSLRQNNGGNAPARNAFAVYTSREDAVEAAKDIPNSIILGISMKELVEQYGEHKKVFEASGVSGEFTGCIIDPKTIIQMLDINLMEHSLKVLESVTKK